MKKLQNKGCNRLAVVCVLIAIKLAFVVSLVLYMEKVQIYVSWTLKICSLVVVVWMISKRDNPSYKLAWCIAILLAPLFGGLFYLIFGKKEMSRRQTARIQEHAALQQKQLVEAEHVAQELLTKSPLLYRQSEYVTRVSGFPVCKGTQSEYFSLGEDLFTALMAELEQAERFIFMEYFIIQEGKMWDPILELLKRKVKEGVEVRFIYDDMGSIQTLPAGYDKQLREAGIQTVVFNPMRPRLSSSMNYRDHRKITVIDGNVGFTGGINLADEYINAYPKHGHWKDTAVLLRGDAVRNLTTMFTNLWQFCTEEKLDLSPYRQTKRYATDGFVQPFGDSPIDHFNVAENAYMQMINCAKQYIYITTPYLILDNEMVTALTLAAQSGVDVRIVTPHIPDKWFVHVVTRSYYLQLIEAGVNIYEYTPGFIHAKMLVSDDEICIVGTTNMDYRSFYLHFECGVLFYRSSMVRKVKRDILDTIAGSEKITLSHSKQIMSKYQVLRAVLRAFAPLM